MQEQLQEQELLHDLLQELLQPWQLQVQPLQPLQLWQRRLNSLKPPQEELQPRQLQVQPLQLAVQEAAQPWQL